MKKYLALFNKLISFLIIISFTVISCSYPFENQSSSYFGSVEFLGKKYDIYRLIDNTNSSKVKVTSVDETAIVTYNKNTGIIEYELTKSNIVKKITGKIDIREEVK